MRSLARQSCWILMVFIPFVLGCDTGLAFLERAEGSFERALSVSGPVELEVDTGSGSITIRPGGTSTVRVIGEIRVRDVSRQQAEEKVRHIAANPPIEQTGNRIRIGQISREEYRRNVSISYTIETPPETRVRADTGSGNQEIEGVRGPVEADSGSGNIRVVETGEEVNADTGSGNIEVISAGRGLKAGTGSGNIRATRVSGSVKVGAGSGNIFVEQVGEGDAALETGSGSIEANGVRGALSAETGSGNINVSGTPLREWSVETGSGRVILRLQSDAGCALDLKANSGSVSIRPSLTETEIVSRKEVRGKIRGGGPLVRVRSGSGNITID
ncbi:MAG: DUF4097 family beta strand repeat protein [Acidobacteria bacterium]|nr:DUF4097 family beta strand repeat protein [Acidobacteriota bacterium]